MIRSRLPRAREFWATSRRRSSLAGISIRSRRPRPPIATTAVLAENPAVASFKVYQPKAVVKLDPTFNVNTETFGEEVTFLFEIELKKDAAAGPAELTAQVRYQCCNDTTCLPPKRKTAVATINIDPAAKAEAIAIPAGYTEFRSVKAARCKRGSTVSCDEPRNPQSSGLGLFLLTTFGAGLAAIFTPCVFPMIPFTVSYFINRNSGGSKRDGVIQAVVFCVGVIVFFTGLGLDHQSHRGTHRRRASWATAPGSTASSDWCSSFSD